MTGTNHALTGAIIALAVKKPELVIPLAFLSHFLLDAIPHYNPPDVTARGFTSFEESWKDKFKHPSFIAFFAIDMLLLAIIMISLPLVSTSVSLATMFFSMLAAISPDFIAGRILIYQLLGIKRRIPRKISWLTIFHIRIQWMDRPWGIWVELVWLIGAGLIIIKLL